MKRILLFIITLVVAFTVTSGDIFALSTEQRRVIDSGVYYFNVEESNQFCSNDDVNLIGNDNIERIFNYFLNHGLTREQAAGIAGNAMAESSGDPTIVSSAGYRGIFQWDRNTRWPRLEEFASGRSLDPNLLETQLEFAFDEATQRGNITGIQEQTTVELAAWYWGRFYEVAIIGGSTSTTPMTNVQHLERRVSYAQEALTSYGGSTGGQTGGSTSCVGGNGEDTQFIDGFTVYSQYDPAWRNLPYATSTIGESGCGPAAMAMIITNLTNQQVTPVETANYAAEIGMYQAGVGSSWDIGPRLAERWGLRAEPVAKDVAAITTALRNGALIITPGAGPLPFTTGGHFIVIRGITADGMFRVGDSGHSDTSAQDWDPQLIVQNMRDGGSYAIYR